MHLKKCCSGIVVGSVGMVIGMQKVIIREILADLVENGSFQDFRKYWQNCQWPVVLWIQNVIFLVKRYDLGRFPVIRELLG